MVSLAVMFVYSCHFRCSTVPHPCPLSLPVSRLINHSCLPPSPPQPISAGWAPTLARLASLSLHHLFFHPAFMISLDDGQQCWERHGFLELILATLINACEISPR